MTIIFKGNKVAEEFMLELRGGSSAIPESAVRACVTGEHRPVNPHRQRLLVAAHKATKSLPKASANSKAPKAKAKSKGKQVTVPEKDQTKTKPNARKTEHARNYSAAKSQFLASTLGLMYQCIPYFCKER